MITFTRINKFGRSGLGNKMFQYAGARLYAEYNGFKSAFPAWVGSDVFDRIESFSILEKIQSYFLKTCHLSDQSAYTKTEAVRFILGLDKRLPETVPVFKLHENPRDNLDFYGYFQDDFSIKKLFENKDKVFRWFQFKSDIVKKFNDMTKGLDPWVGIHLRRGDFEERLVLPVADIKLKLMDIQKNRRVFIASNDPKAIDEFSEFNPIRINLKSFGYPAYIFDFLMLKDSEAIIGCGSTFSWWAAYLGNKDEYYSPPLTHLWQSWKDKKIEKVRMD